MNFKLTSLAFSSLLVVSLGACASDGYAYRDGGYHNSRDRYAHDTRYDDRYSDRRRCSNCGVVERIDVERGRERSSGGGAVLGAVVGAALGNQVGSGSGRKAATVAGAVAGGVAGNNIERNRNDRDNYEVYVRLDNGRTLVLEQRRLNGIREGSRVVVNDGEARLM